MFRGNFTQEPLDLGGCTEAVDLLAGKLPKLFFDERAVFFRKTPDVFDERPIEPLVAPFGHVGAGAAAILKDPFQHAPGQSQRGKSKKMTVSAAAKRNSSVLP